MVASGTPPCSPSQQAPRVELEDFLRALFPSKNIGLLEVRALPSGARSFIRPDDYRAMRRFIRRHRDKNLFFGVATRTEPGDGSLANCRDLWGLWADIDFNTSPEVEARERLAAFPLPPSIVIRSGHGLHAYWLLEHVTDLRRHSERVRTILRALAQRLGADISAAEPARVLRLPGTDNFKYPPPRRVVVETLAPERTYELVELEQVVASASEQSGTRFTVPPAIVEGTRNSTFYRLARSLTAQGLTARAILVPIPQYLGFIRRKRTQPVISKEIPVPLL